MLHSSPKVHLKFMTEVGEKVDRARFGLYDEGVLLSKFGLGRNDQGAVRAVRAVPSAASFFARLERMTANSCPVHGNTAITMTPINSGV